MKAFLVIVAGAVFDLWKQLANVTLKFASFVTRPNLRNNKVSAKNVWFYCLIFICLIITCVGLSAQSTWFLTPLALASVFNLLVSLSALALILEEGQVMDGLLEKERRTIKHVGPGKSGRFLFWLGILNILGLASIAYAIDGQQVALFINRPTYGLGPFDYIVHVLNATPYIGPVLQMLHEDTGTRYSRLSGKAFLLAVQVTTTLTLVTLFWWLVARNIRFHLLFSALIASDVPSGTRHFLQFKLARAPSETKVPILQLAMGPAAQVQRFVLPEIEDERNRIQRLAINITPHAEIFTFPSTFIYGLHCQTSEDVKRRGLIACFRIIRKYKPEYVEEWREDIRSQLRKQLFEKKYSTSHNREVLEDLRQILVWVNDRWFPQGN